MNKTLARQFLAKVRAFFIVKIKDPGTRQEADFMFQQLSDLLDTFDN